MSGEERSEINEVGGAGGQGSVLERLSDEMADAVAEASGSVVAVSGGRKSPGSGTVYADGLALTTLHVVGDGDGLRVTDHSGESTDAELAGYDHRSGLALLKFEGLDARLATPSEVAARVGQLSLSLARSGGGIRAGFGIVGSLRGGTRRGGRLGGSPYMRIDTAPYFGLGGGAVISAGGDLLGVVASGDRGSTFAVPSSKAWEIASRLESGGSLRRGYLGVYSQPVRLPDPQSLGLAQEGGLLVAGVSDGTPAAEAGMMVGDIIATLDGQPVRDTDDLMVLLQGERVGRTIAVKVVRGGVLADLAVTIGERTHGGGCGHGR